MLIGKPAMKAGQKLMSFMVWMVVFNINEDITARFKAKPNNYSYLFDNNNWHRHYSHWMPSISIDV